MLRLPADVLTVKDKDTDTISVQDNVIAELRETVTEVQHTNTELQQVNEELRKENVMLLQSGRNGVGHAKRFVMNNEGDGPIAFTAGIVPHSVDHLQHKDTIKFETLITNIGGGYNNQSGIFVAPVAGIYLFSCSLMDDLEEHGLMLHAEIVHNQRVLGRIFARAEPNNHRDQGAQTVVAHVNQGDQIWVRTLDNQNLGLGGELYSTFTGYLLLAM